MKATITSVKSQPSKHGGIVYLATFACEDGKSRRSWLDPKNGNFKRWEAIIAKGKGTAVGNLNVKDEVFINADSFPMESTLGL